MGTAKRNTTGATRILDLRCPGRLRDEESSNDESSVNAVFLLLSASDIRCLLDEMKTGEVLRLCPRRLEGDHVARLLAELHRDEVDRPAEVAVLVGVTAAL